MRNKLIEMIQESVDGCARYWASVIADYLIANSVTVQRWIPASEMLPEENVKVLVFGNGCFALSEIFLHDCDGEPMWSYTGIGCDPEYWMPLPEPPQEEA